MSFACWWCDKRYPVKSLADDCVDRHNEELDDEDEDTDYLDEML